MTQDEPIVSHGRGGQGNIHPDPTEYVDGEITREGPIGDQGDGAYSAGRGGAGNIGSPHIRPSTPGKAHDSEVIPDIAVRSSLEGDYHVGRGGQGNVHLDEAHHQKGKANQKDKEKEEVPTYTGLADKLKHKVLGKK